MAKKANNPFARTLISNANMDPAQKFRIEEAYKSIRTNIMLSILKKAKAIITESGTINTHAAIVGQTLDIPVIVGAPHATDIIRHGSTVTVDAQRGTVYSGVAKV